jgi:hypothetical protein
MWDLEICTLGLDKSRSTGAVTALGPWFGTAVLRRECYSTINSADTNNLVICISNVEKLVGLGTLCICASKSNKAQLNVGNIFELIPTYSFSANSKITYAKGNFCYFYNWFALIADNNTTAPRAYLQKSPIQPIFWAKFFSTSNSCTQIKSGQSAI